MRDDDSAYMTDLSFDADVFFYLASCNKAGRILARHEMSTVLLTAELSAAATKASTESRYDGTIGTKIFVVYFLSKLV